MITARGGHAAGTCRPRALFLRGCDLRLGLENLRGTPVDNHERADQHSRAQRESAERHGRHHDGGAIRHAVLVDKIAAGAGEGQRATRRAFLSTTAAGRELVNSDPRSFVELDLSVDDAKH